MATPYLISKWRMWWKSLDTNHDGYLSTADLEETKKAFLRLTHLDSATIEKAKVTFDKVWKTIIFRKMEGKITEDMFVAAVQRDYVANREKFIGELRQGYYDIFNVYDFNGDHFISLDEFLIAFKSVGHDNIIPEKELFVRLGPVDGKVPVSKLVEAVLIFTCNPDDTVRDFVKEALEAGA